MVSCRAAKVGKLFMRGGGRGGGANGEKKGYSYPFVTGPCARGKISNLRPQQARSLYGSEDWGNKNPPAEVQCILWLLPGPGRTTGGRKRGPSSPQKQEKKKPIVSLETRPRMERTLEGKREEEAPVCSGQREVLSSGAESVPGRLEKRRLLLRSRHRGEVRPRRRRPRSGVIRHPFQVKKKSLEKA